MKLPLRTELQELLKQNDGPCVSLFIPTHRTSSADRRQGPKQLENLLDRASERLINRGLRRPESESMLARAHALVKDVGYWQNTASTEGLLLHACTHYQLSGAIFKSHFSRPSVT